MIYTATFNPSLDYIVQLDTFTAGAVNRTKHERIFGGGKGINVSIVLHNLGVDSITLGFIAGFTGDEIERQVKSFGCKTDFIHLSDGLSRINVKLKADVESEINGQGPEIDKTSLKAFFGKLNQIHHEDVLVLAGSIPSTLPSDIYEKIMEHLADKSIKIVVDATCNLLLNVLKYKPFLIKPNHHELGEIFNTQLKTDEEIISCAKNLQAKGAQNVLVSMAGDGAILITSDGKIYKSPVPKGTVKNSVGAGDSMVAGFLAGLLTTNNIEKAFKISVATGSASAFSEELATKEEVMKLLQQL